MKIYNTLTHKIEEFIPNEEGKVKIYTCGPTVYHYAHIGNMRNYIGHDILVRAFKYLGYEVTRAMNITDVGHLTSDSDSGEDKMMKAAKNEGKTAMEIADFYTKAFFEDYDKLNLLRPDILKPATGEIDMYIKMIEKLINDGYAYVSGGNVYFDVSKLDDYYKLTNHIADDMVVGVREGVEEDASKKNQADFALWFTTSKFENHELLWDSPWGKGYPGWHIECSGISLKYLGDSLDIHGGGVDNIFPHHTNEIAQSESYLGHKWCNYWFHNEHLIDDSGKMSKSKGDILTVSKLENEGYDPIAFRFMCLNSHYKKQLLFTYEGLTQASDTLSKLKKKVQSINDEGEFEEEKFNKYHDRFAIELENNLNTANALSVLYELLKDNEVNGHTKLEIINSFEEVLALNLMEIKKSNVDESYILEMIEKRNQAKKDKDYEKADKIREELENSGIILLDTREGTKFEVK